MEREDLVTIFIHQTTIYWVLHYMPGMILRPDSWHSSENKIKTFTLVEFNSSNTDKNNTDKK